SYRKAIDAATQTEE
nr:Chain C, Protein Chica peptide [Drosophila melanogaster]